MSDLDSPALVMARLEEIERDLAIRGNQFEEAAREYVRLKRDREHARAAAFLKATGTVAERQAKADVATVTIGVEAEGRFEGLKGVMRTLDTRAGIGMSILKAQGRSQ